MADCCRQHFKCIFLNENVWIANKISLKFVPKSLINNKPSLVQLMAWRRTNDGLVHLMYNTRPWLNWAWKWIFIIEMVKKISGAVTEFSQETENLYPTIIYASFSLNELQHIEAETKWLPFPIHYTLQCIINKNLLIMHKIIMIIIINCHANWN